MKYRYVEYYVSLSLILLLSWTISCSGRSGKKSEAKTDPLSESAVESVSKLIKMVSPEENTGFKLKDQVKVIIEAVDKAKLPDSVLISWDGKHVKTMKAGPWEYTIPSALSVTTGRKSLKAAAYKGGKLQNTITRFMIIYSDVVPKRYGYKVIHTYPHDREAFTQGLFYDKGVLYEGTGQKAGSSLREVELETGKVLRQHNLEGSLFGEGITLYHDLIYQVTWQNKVGFIYEKSTFNLVNKIYYPTEGWGLTTINDRIVMSDGTNVIYFFEPEMFTVMSRLEVYDNKEMIDSLNELEYINGEIWANVWMTDHIVRIDPASGKVLAIVDLKGLLPSSEMSAGTDVLNGIAFDQAGNRIFVTGKNWPKLFEIRPTE